jgi:hypothetical protein
VNPARCRGHPDDDLGAFGQSVYAADEQVAEGVGHLVGLADGGSQQLFSKKGVSLRTRLDAVDQGWLCRPVEDGRQQLPHLDPGKRTKLDWPYVTAAFELAEHRPQRMAPVEVIETVGADQQDSLPPQVAGQEHEQVPRGGVCPVQILEYEDGRLLPQPL